jgi:subtilisin family serine protease
MRFPLTSLFIIILLSLHVHAQSHSGFIVEINPEYRKADIAELLPTTTTIRQIIDIPRESKLSKALSAKSSSYLNRLEKYFMIEINDNKTNIYKLFENSNLIKSIEPNYIFRINQQTEEPNDPFYDEQWGFQNINIEEAWSHSNGEGIIVGVIDTGIDYNHPDLKNRLWINSEEDYNQNGHFDPWPIDEERFGVYGDFDGVDNDGNGYTDDVIGYDLIDQSVRNVGDDRTPDPIPWDEHSHGTKVSGVIGAERDNETGICGASYGAKILTARAFDALGNAESDDIAAAIVYAALAGADVLNFSFGEYTDSKIQKDAVMFAASLGCVMVASSGNDGSRKPHFPSDYDEVISVGASTINDERAPFSDYGVGLDLIAPGVEIWTTDISEVDGQEENYTQFGGTSAAAPFVTATAALLRSIDNNLTAEEIKGIIISTARSREWDRYAGSGVLDAGLALSYSGTSDIRFHNPQNEQYFDIESGDDLDIVATIITPLFEHYQLFIGEGINTNNFDSLTSKVYEQKQFDTIYSIKKDFFRDTSYTLRLLITLKNKRTIEDRLTLHSVPSDPKTFFISQKEHEVFNNNKRDIRFSAATRYQSKYSVRYWKEDTPEDITELTEVQDFDYFHALVTEGDLIENVNYLGQAIAVRDDGTADTIDISFSVGQGSCPETGFYIKYPTLSPSYVNNNVSDLYSNGRQSFAVNDLSTGTWGVTKTYEFSEGEIKEKDSFPESWLPRDIGDSNGDGIPEIFSLSYPRSVLFQAATKGGNPFETKIFTSPNDFLAQQMYDLNGDGKDELIGLSVYDGIVVYENIDGTYTQTHRVGLPEGIGNIGTAPGFALGDFDGDGLTELMHGSMLGQYFVYKYRNGNIEYIYHDDNLTSGSSQYMASGDFDGDGLSEIAILNYGSFIPYERYESTKDLWNLRIIDFADGKYKAIIMDHFNGVRGGSAYSNGIAAGNVDNDDKDEIVVGVFPNLYILKLNEEKTKLEPIWYIMGAFTNSAIIHDFDLNGINEVGFTSFGDMRFVEFDGEFNGPDSPLDFEGWAEYEDKARLNWKSAANAMTYEIFELDSEGRGELIGETNETEVLIGGLQQNAWYRYTVRSKNNSMPDTVSPIADPIEVFTHPIVSVSDINQINSHQIKISFDGKIKPQPIQPGKVILLRDEQPDFVPRTILPNGDSSYVATFREELKTEEVRMEIGSFRDYFNSPTAEFDTLFYTIQQDSDPDELYLKKLVVVSNLELILTYSEAIEENSSTFLQNYSLQPRGKIIAIEKTGDSEVKLLLDENESVGALGDTYSLTGKNVISIDGKPITTGAGNTLAFVFSNPTLNNTIVFPNPVRLSESSTVKFGNLTSLATVEVYHIDGRRLAVLEEIDGNGAVEWDCRDEQGDLLDTGIYLYKVKGSNTEGVEYETEMRKFAVIR